MDVLLHDDADKIDDLPPHRINPHPVTVRVSQEAGGLYIDVLHKDGHSVASLRIDHYAKQLMLYAAPDPDGEPTTYHALVEDTTSIT